MPVDYLLRRNNTEVIGFSASFGIFKSTGSAATYTIPTGGRAFAVIFGMYCIFDIVPCRLRQMVRNVQKTDVCKEI